MDKKDVAVGDVGLCEKLGILWYTNKPLAIFLALLATIIVAGIVFCIVWFLILPHQAAQSSSSAPSGTVSSSTSPSGTTTSTSTSTPAPTSTTTTSHAAFLHLRSMLDE